MTRSAPSPATNGVADTGSPDLLLSGATLVFVDVETTGLDSQSGDRVCEISIIRQAPSKRPQTWSSLIDPERAISPGAFAVNGITPEMLSGAPRFAEVADRILALSDSGIWVAHNAPFDLGFLRQEFEICGRPFPARPTIDTVALARRLFRFPSNSLTALAREFGIRNVNAHRALTDCHTMRKVLRAMISEAFPDSDPTVGSLIKPASIPADAESDRWDLLPDGLARGLEANRELEIVYVSADGESTIRTIRVKDVVEAGGHVYLVADCMLRHDERNFRLDRIVDFRSKTKRRHQSRPADDLVIRPLVESEIPRLWAIWTAADLPFRPTGRDAVANLVVQWRANPDGMIGAFDGQRMVGSVLATDDGRRGWINRIAVDPKYRRQGLAGRLAASAETFLKSRGRLVIGALIDEENEGSHGLFASLGYEYASNVQFWTKRDSPDA
ncbi:MAG: GNAT family N-acetyltransferase [Acidobacteria bacterium]|nr:GNAT family N-acetyltransferase [Acidobacteriota bacterium]